MPCAIVGDAHSGQGGLFTHLKKEPLNHLVYHVSPMVHSDLHRVRHEHTLVAPG